MTTQTTLPQPEDVEGFPDNDNAEIVLFRGKIRVVEKKLYWDEVNNRRRGKREYLGYVVDGKYYSNDSYQKKFKDNTAPQSEKAAKSRSTAKETPRQPRRRYVAQNTVAYTLQAHAVPLLYEAARDTGLVEDWEMAIGDTDARLMISMAIHWLLSYDHSPFSFNSWKKDMLFPFMEDLSDREAANFLTRFATNPSLAEKFFLARLRRLEEKELISFDATQIACEPAYYTVPDLVFMDSDFEPEKTKVILLLSRKTAMPVLFKILPFRSDIAKNPKLLFDFDELKKTQKQISFAVVDFANYSLENLASFIDQKRPIAIPAKYEAGGWIEKIINEARNTPLGGSGWGKEKDSWYKTILTEKTFEDGKSRKVWVHVYCSENQIERQNRQFEFDLDTFEGMWRFAHASPEEADEDSFDGCYLRKNPLMKYYIRDSGIPGKEKPKRNEEAIAMEKAEFGFFAITSTIECSAQDALRGLMAYLPVATTFRSEREEAPKDPSVLIGTDRQQGHMLIAFTALTILTHIENRMQLETVVTRNGKKEVLPPLSETTSFGEICMDLSGATLAFCSSGKRFWEDTGQDVRDLAERLGYPGLYDKIPDWIY